MKYIFIAIFLSIILSFESIFHPFVINRSSNIVEDLVYMIDKPVVYGLNATRSFVNEYFLLIGTEKENKLLKLQLAKVKLENRVIVDALNKRNSIVSKNVPFKLIPTKFGIKGYFREDEIYITPRDRLNLKKNNCVVISENMDLIGIVETKKNNVYGVKTVFNDNFAADIYVINNKRVYRAIFIGSNRRGEAKFFDITSDITKGLNVYTSGAFGKYPKGLKLGSISKVVDVNGLYKMAYVDIPRGFFNDFNLYTICEPK